MSNVWLLAPGLIGEPKERRDGGTVDRTELRTASQQNVLDSGLIGRFAAQEAGSAQ